MTDKGKIRIIAPTLPAALSEAADGRELILEAKCEDTAVEETLFKGISLEDVDLHKMTFEQTVFENCSFRGANLEKASFINAVFKGCDLSNARFGDGYFSRCELVSVKGVGTDFHECLFKELLIRDCVLSFANFSGSRWENALFEENDLKESFLADCRLKKVIFTKNNFRRASFFQTALKGIDFRGNVLEEPVLSEQGGELKGAVVDLYQAAELAKLFGIVIR